MRAEIDVETFLKIILVLVVVWLVLGIVGRDFRVFFGLLGSVVGVFVVVLIVLWLFDRI